MKTPKEEIKPEEIIDLMDFAENCSFVEQDATQGFHWENSQITLHPFIIYQRISHGKIPDGISSKNFCVISNCLKHDTVAVIFSKETDWIF